MFRRAGMKSIVTCMPGVMWRTVRLASGTPGSVAGLPTRAACCALPQVSSDALVAGGEAVSAGGEGAGVDVGVDEVDAFSGSLADGLSGGLHAARASGARATRDRCFIGRT